MPSLLTAPAASALALLQSTSLTHLAAASIEALILGGELPPGSKLNEMALAQRFGISRGPLREALRTLEESGLVQQEKNRGAHVRQIALSEAADIYDVRAGLDATAGWLLAERITAAQLQTLRTMTAAMRDVPPDAVDRFHALNLDFHDSIVAMTGNPVLFRRRNLLAPLAIPRFAEEHSAIVDLLAARDGAAAAEALRHHALVGRQRMVRDGELAAPQ
jgi:DNA-binding GntR family transcriptional regulator